MIRGKEAYCNLCLMGAFFVRSRICLDRRIRDLDQLFFCCFERIFSFIKKLCILFFRAMFCWMLRFAFLTRSLGAERGWGIPVVGECSGLDGGPSYSCWMRTLESAIASVAVMIWALYLLC